MKNKLHYFILLFVLAALTGCNEKLSIETEIQGAPEISEFTPTSGKAGTEITVKGSNLRDIVSATIGGVESQILYKLSQQEIVIVVPREGTKSGKIVLATSRKDDAGESTRAESAQSFSVTYPTPRVTDFPKGGRVETTSRFWELTWTLSQRSLWATKRERSFIRVKKRLR